jgi:hypothetical protein
MNQIIGKNQGQSPIAKSNTVSLQFGKQHRQFLETQMAAMQAAYPNQAMEPETAAVFILDWAELGAKYGKENLEKALHDHRHQSRFFPQIAELRDRLEAAKERPEFKPEVPPCGCSKEHIVAQGVTGCVHGTIWGMAAAAQLLGKKVSHPINPDERAKEIPAKREAK